ncbi:MAG: hypothetical protein U0930_03770 [Pirellulales bacterium]
MSSIPEISIVDSFQAKFSDGCYHVTVSDQHGNQFNLTDGVQLKWLPVACLAEALGVRVIHLAKRLKELAAKNPRSKFILLGTHLVDRAMISAVVRPIDKPVIVIYLANCSILNLDMGTNQAADDQFTLMKYELNNGERGDSFAFAELCFTANKAQRKLLETPPKPEEQEPGSREGG